MARTKKRVFKKNMLKLLSALVPKWVEIYSRLSEDQVAQLEKGIGERVRKLGDMSTWADKVDDDNGESVADSIIALAQLIALQSFQEGGVTFMGRIWKNRRKSSD